MKWCEDVVRTSVLDATVTFVDNLLTTCQAGGVPFRGTESIHPIIALGDLSK